MRLFVAATLDERVRRQAAALADECRARARRLAPDARMTWVTPDQLHVTVRFIGQVDEARAAAIRDALSPPLPVPPFEFTIAGAGTFPGRGQPRVLWAGVTRGRDRFVSLEEEVSRRLAGVGLEREDRAYSPHVTLARVRDAAGLRADRWLAGLTSAPVGAVLLPAITLFESRGSSKGSTYVPLLETPLHAGTGRAGGAS